MLSYLNYFNDGVTDTGVLFILVLIDTALALSYQIKERNNLLSSTLLAGLLRNFVLCFMPILVAGLKYLHPRTDNLYQMIAAVLSIYIGYAIIQSILAYAQLWGIEYPEWLQKWLSEEVQDKEKKANHNGITVNTSRNSDLDKRSQSSEENIKH